MDGPFIWEMSVQSSPVQMESELLKSDETLKNINNDRFSIDKFTFGEAYKY